MGMPSIARAAHARRLGCAAALLCGLFSVGTGCVQRRMTIRSSPPGALVYVDDYQIGTTPVSTDFIYYGTRKIRLVKDGYETLTVRQPIPAPWYEYFPLDFVTENLWPWEIRDERVVDLAMSTTASTPPESVVARAEQVRLAAGALPAPPPAVVTPPPAAPRPIPAPPPQQPLPPPNGGLTLPPPSNAPAFPPTGGGVAFPPTGGGVAFPPTGGGVAFPPSAPMQGLQPPLQNAPSQGVPGLGPRP